MKKKTDMRTQILEAITRLGPSSPRQVLDQVGGTEKKVGYYLRALKSSGALKATGASASRVYALPSQKMKGARAATKATKATASNPAAETPIAALTVDRRLVLAYANEAGVGRATVFAAEFTDPIAQLLKKAA